MAVHVGVDPYSQHLLLYDGVENVTRSLKLNGCCSLPLGPWYRKEDQLSLFKEIKSKVFGKLGCACIYLNLEFGNEIRKTMIKEGLDCGFANVEFLNRCTALYFGAMSQINYKPVNDNIIWIEWFNNFYVWKIDNQKAKFVGIWSASHLNKYALLDIVKETKLKREPDFLLCDVNAFQHASVFANYKNEIWVGALKCQLFTYDGNDALSRGCLIKSRLTAGDPEFNHLDAANYFDHKITLKIRETEIASFSPNHQLPIYFSQRLTTTSKDTLSLQVIYANDTLRAAFKIPNFSDIYLLFEMDLNGIYSVNFSEHEFSRFDFNKVYVIPKKEILLKKDFHAVGIDLGTSRCCAAVNRNDGITTVPLDNTGERLLPSYVSYDEENMKCGNVVMKRLRHFYKSTIFDSKRIIGRSFNDIEIDENWNFNVSFENKKVYMEIKGVHNKRKQITAEEVASDLLKFMKHKSEEYQGVKIRKAVITVPAAFTEEQKTATMKAAKLAGWSDIHLLPEPMAAAFAYFINRPIPNNSTVLLFDLGGGTLDVCIFKVENNEIQIISNTGDSKLGGRNFDTVLINYFKNLLNIQHGITTLKDKKYKLMLECQRIKEDLTSLTSTSLDIDEFDAGKQGVIPINREGFQRMTQPLLNKVKNTVQSALFNSNLKENQINQVLHVGGGSRMPMINQLLQDIFPDAEHRREEHPDEVVAIGAAYYAYSIFSN